MSYVGSGYILTSKDRSKVASRELAAKAEEKEISIYESKWKAQDAQKKYREFVGEIKEFLMIDGLSRVLENCLPSNIDSHLQAYGKSIITKFIKEEYSVDRMLYDFPNKSLLLAEFSGIIESTYDTILEKVDKDDIDTICIHSSDLENFRKKIDGACTNSQLEKVIGERIVKAESDFVIASNKDKAAMEKMMNDTEDKINSVRGDTAEDENEMKQEAVRDYRYYINNLQDRPKTILESIVYRTSKGILSNDQIRSQFITENGRLDMNRVIDISEVMYTFLEMVNTLNIKKIDEAYLEKTLSSIK